MKISISGKGGSGKTTISGTLARSFARRGFPVMAIDGDSNPSLAGILGLPPEQAAALPYLPETILEDWLDAEGKRHQQLTMSVEEIADRYGIQTVDGVRLLVMKKFDHAGMG